MLNFIESLTDNIKEYQKDYKKFSDDMHVHIGHNQFYLKRLLRRPVFTGRGEGNLNLKELPPGTPIWFTDKPKNAHWFAMERSEGKPTIIEAILHVKKPANFLTLQNIYLKLIKENPDIEKNPYVNNYNENDLIYIPEVRAELEKQGYDSLLVWDQLENYEIPALVIWNPQQIIKKYSIWSHGEFDGIMDKPSEW